MSGKSYLAERFESPLVINTEGNAESGTAPYVRLVLEKLPNVDYPQLTIDEMSDFFEAIRSDTQGYKTLIFDVTDEIFDLFKAYTIKKYDAASKDKVEVLSDVPFGKAHDFMNTMINNFMIQVKNLNKNIIFTSWSMSYTDEQGNDVTRPSLKEAQYKKVAGNADLVIETKKIGNNYIRRVTDRRKKYVREEIDDPKVLRILENVSGALDKSPEPKKQPAKTAAK